MRQFRQVNELDYSLEDIDTHVLQAINEIPQSSLVLPDLQGAPTTPIPSLAWPRKASARKIDATSIAIGMLVVLVFLLLVLVGLLLWMR